MEWYRTILAVHVIAIISWMAGILYLYRLLVYASEQGTDKPAVYTLLKTMTRRLLWAITVPAMILAWAMGLSMLALNQGLLSMPWVHIKLTSVVVLTGATIYAAKLVKRYQVNVRPLPSSRNLRILNEVPTLLMIIIVCLAILKPQWF